MFTLPWLMILITLPKSTHNNSASKSDLPTCSKDTLLLMLRKQSMSNPQTNNNSINATLLVKIPSFPILTTSEPSIPTVPNPSTPKVTAPHLIRLQLLLPSQTESVNKVTDRIPLKSHLKLLSSVINLLTLNAKEDSSPEPWTTLNFTDLSIPAAHLTTLPLRILPRLALKS